MATVETFKKSIWRRIDEHSAGMLHACKDKAEEFKNSLVDPETREKIKKAAVFGAGAVLFVLHVRRELKPTLADVERYRKAHSFYDPHTHIRFSTRKKISPAVANEILERTSKGERAHDILKEKKLI